MNRRTFDKLALSSFFGISMSPIIANTIISNEPYIRLGGPVFGKYDDPEAWIKMLKQLGYRAAYCPVKPGVDSNLIREYKKAAVNADIIIAEVGAWGNTISPNNVERKVAIDLCVKSLELAENIGANCCVNVSGSRNPEHWAGPHQDNLTDDTFDLIVETTRLILDEVKPERTFFALESMPWAYPDSVDSYLKLIKAIDRKQFGAHLDPVNMIVSPQTYYHNGAIIKDCFERLGPYIKSCHAKDIKLREDIYTPHLDEVIVGTGNLDYHTFLKELSKLKDIPLVMEHLKTAEEYAQAADYIRSVARKVNITI